MNSIKSSEYKHVLASLVSMRKLAGLTQRQLAQRLKREHSFVWRIETGQRRIDVIEFYWLCKAIKQNPVTMYRNLVKAITQGKVCS